MDIVIIVLLAVALIFMIIILIRMRKPKEDQSFLMIKEDLESIRKSVENQLNLVTNQVGYVGNRFESATKEFAEVQKGLVKLEESSKRIYDIGKDIASLQELLKPPKLRGGLGELSLENLLNNILPKKYFTLQYTFKNGTKVDAVIHLWENRLVSVDSKFPLENFRRILTEDTDQAKISARRQFARDVKKHVDDIAQKYILPDERTFDFALMYIPAENIYYEMIAKDEESEKSIDDYAVSRKVIPVSPNTFYAYLQTITLGLKGMEIEKNTEDVIRSLRRLKVDFEKFRGDFNILGSHISNTKKKYDDTVKGLERFGEKLLQVENQKPTEEQESNHLFSKQEKEDGSAL